MENILELIEVISKEKGIEKEKIFEYVEMGLKASFKKQFGENKECNLNIDRNTGKINLSIVKTVVKKVEDENREISLSEARKTFPGYQEGDQFLIEVDPMEFGRNSARAAAQSLYQNILIAEREILYNFYKEKQRELVNGVVQRTYNKNVYVNLGKIDGILPIKEQIPGEQYEVGQRIKVLITDVTKTNKDPIVHLSRTHPDLIKRLFELEVPEIYEGDIIIKSIAREPGHRTKIAIENKNELIDTLGACVGPSGTRVKAIVDEISGEKIDIIEYDKDPEIYISNALKPAKVNEVAIIEDNSAMAIVPDFQLSLAIGKDGQNARLAAKLTGWKIDIKSQSQVDNYQEPEDEEAQDGDA